jgi:hypothetical protein
MVSAAASGFLIAKRRGIDHIQELDALKIVLEMCRFNPDSLELEEDGRVFLSKLGHAVTEKVQELETVDQQR